MMVESEYCDLRMLSLLHALGDKEEVILEAFRLLTALDMDDASWRQIRDIGHDIAPEHPLFDPDQNLAEVHNQSTLAALDLGQNNTDGHRQKDNREMRLRLVSDQRSEDLRANNLSWQGEERRREVRRLSGKMYLVN